MKMIVRLAGIVMAGCMMLIVPALAAGTGKAASQEPAHGSQAHPAEYLKGFFTAAIDVASHAARSTSDTVHHNAGNVMDTVAKARGFVRDTVSGVLGNARKLSGMVGDVMPFTEHNHYEAGAAADKRAE